MEMLHDMPWLTAEAHAMSTGEKIRRWNVVDQWLVYTPGVWWKEYFAGPLAGVMRPMKAGEFSRADYVATDYTNMRPDQFACPTEPLPEPVPEEPGGPVRFIMNSHRAIGLPPWTPGERRLYPAVTLPDGTVIPAELRDYYRGDQIEAAWQAFYTTARHLEIELRNPLSVPAKLTVQSRIWYTTPLYIPRIPVHIGDLLFEGTVIDFERHFDARESLPLWVTAPTSRLIDPTAPRTSGRAIASLVLDYWLCVTVIPE